MKPRLRSTQAHSRLAGVSFAAGLVWLALAMFALVVPIAGNGGYEQRWRFDSSM